MLSQTEKYALLLMDQQMYALQGLFTVYLQLKDDISTKEILRVFEEKDKKNSGGKFEFTITEKTYENGQLVETDTLVLKTRVLQEVLTHILENNYLNSDEDAVTYAINNGKEYYLTYDKLTYEEKIRVCAAEYRCIYHLKDELTAEMVKEIFKANPETKWSNFPSEAVCKFTDEEILELMEIDQGLMWHLHYRINSKELLYGLLQIIVQKKYPYKIGYFGNGCHSHLVRQDLQDKVYFQALGMVDGFNYQFIPKEYVSEKLIHYTLDNSVEKQHLSFMYERLEDKFKTAEISKRCIEHCPICVRHLPENLANEEFYLSLLDDGLHQFITWVPDFNKLSKKVILKWLEVYPKDKWLQTSVKIPHMDDLEVAKKALDIGGIYDDSFPVSLFKDDEFCALYAKKRGYSKHLKKEMLTRDFWKECATTSPYAVSKIMPGEYKDDDMYDHLVSQRVSMSCIPYEYRTDERLLIYAKEGKLSPSDIPESCKSKEVWLELYKNRQSPCFGFPPEELQTEEICLAILKTYDKKGYNHYACLPALKYVPEEYRKVCVEESASALKDIPNPTRELIDYALECHPEAKLYAPDWYFNDEPMATPIPATSSRSRSATVAAQMEVLANSEFEQMSIFDLFKIA